MSDQQAVVTSMVDELAQVKGRFDKIAASFVSQAATITTLTEQVATLIAKHGEGPILTDLKAGLDGLLADVTATAALLPFPSPTPPSPVAPEPAPAPVADPPPAVPERRAGISHASEAAGGTGA